jgi:Fe-Mn family superoxide dismutase
MTLHHSKHHNTYVTLLNSALQAQATALATNDLAAQLHNQVNINFAAGGHINHTLFWANLAPASSADAQETAAPKLLAAIAARWGSVEAFKAAFNAVLLGLKGSGWGWLVQDVDSGALEIVTTKDQDIVAKGKKPLFGVDMWEHAYYLQYLNDKASYVKGIWGVLNWSVIESRFGAGLEFVFGELGGLKGSL